MKLLVLSIPLSGHVNPLVPQVLELLTRGHEVVFATTGPANGMPGLRYDDAKPVPLEDQDTSRPFHALPRKVICEQLRLKIDGPGSDEKPEPSAAAEAACDRYTYVSLGPPPNLDHILRIAFDPQSPPHDVLPRAGKYFGEQRRMMFGRLLQAFDRFGERYAEFQKLSVAMHGPKPLLGKIGKLWREHRPEFMAKDLVRDILNGTKGEFLPIAESQLEEVGGYEQFDHKTTSRRFDAKSYKLLNQDGGRVRKLLKDFYPDLIMTDITTPVGGDLAQILDVPVSVHGWGHGLWLRLTGPHGFVQPSYNLPHHSMIVHEQAFRDWANWGAAVGEAGPDGNVAGVTDQYPLNHIVHMAKRVRRFLLNKVQRTVVDNVILPPMLNCLRDFGIAHAHLGQHTNNVVRPETLELRKRDGQVGKLAGARPINPERIVNSPALIQPQYVWNDLPGMGPVLPLPPAQHLVGVVYENSSPLPADEETIQFLEKRGPGGKPKKTVFVSFGSMVKLFPSDAKLIFKALERVAAASNGEMQFLWSLRLNRMMPDGGVRAGDAGDVEKMLTELGADPERGSERVRVKHWVRQGAVLQHPNVAAFLTHSGVNSMHEGILNGKPLIGLPFGGDQFINAQIIEGSGIGWFLLRGREFESISSKFAAADGGTSSVSDAEAALQDILFDEKKLETARGHLRRWKAISDFQGGAKKSADVVEHLHKIGTTEHAQFIDSDPRQPMYAAWDLDIWAFLFVFWYGFVWRGILSGGIFRTVKGKCCSRRANLASGNDNANSNLNSDENARLAEHLARRPPSVAGDLALEGTLSKQVSTASTTDNSNAEEAQGSQTGLRRRLYVGDVSKS